MIEANLVLLRHGESMWNKKNLFTGWVDVPLSQGGIDEAINAGKELENFCFDSIYCSTLVRSLETAMLCMAQNLHSRTPVIQHPSDQKLIDWGKIYSEKMNQDSIPVWLDSALNERYYGHLQGQNKDEARAKFGADQVQIWRRSFDIPPPSGEALLNTSERSIPFFEERIASDLQMGKRVLVVAHGNSLRSIIMKLDQLTPEQILKFELATGRPRYYSFTEKSGFKNLPYSE